METARLEDYVATLFGINAADLFTATRRREVVEARHLCMSIMREFTNQTLTKIGRHFNRDHATVMFAIKMVRDLYGTDKQFRHKADATYNLCRCNALIIPGHYIAVEDYLDAECVQCERMRV